MPTRKQRRRRAKEFRHEYVWEDAEGNELDPEEAPGKKNESRARRPAARAGREPQAPSWRRTLKRGLIFAPVMFVVVMLVAGDQPLSGQIVQTVLILLIFVPFSYFLDVMLWRSFRRRSPPHDDAGGGRSG
jgi:hypothetical protein